MRFLVSVLWSLVGAILGNTEMHDAVLRIVQDAADLDITGEEKRARVLADLRAMKGPLGEVIAATGTALLNLAIEAAVFYVRSRAPQP